MEGHVTHGMLIMQLLVSKGKGKMMTAKEVAAELMMVEGDDFSTISSSHEGNVSSTLIVMCRKVNAPIRRDGAYFCLHEDVEDWFMEEAPRLKSFHEIR